MPEIDLRDYMSLSAAAKALGVSRRTMTNYTKPDHPYFGFIGPVIYLGDRRSGPNSCAALPKSRVLSLGVELDRLRRWRAGK